MEPTILQTGNEKATYGNCFGNFYRLSTSAASFPLHHHVKLFWFVVTVSM